MNPFLQNILLKNFDVLWQIWVIFSRILKQNKVKVTQSCLTLCDPMDYRVHAILQARILEWVAVPFSRGSSQPRDQTQVSHIVDSLPAEVPGNDNTVHFSSVTQSCQTLCDPMNRSTPGLPVHHQLPEFTQPHVHHREGNGTPTPVLLPGKSHGWRSLVGCSPWGC